MGADKRHGVVAVRAAAWVHEFRPIARSAARSCRCQARYSRSTAHVPRSRGAEDPRGSRSMNTRIRVVIRQLRRRVCEQRRQLRGCNFGVIQGKMAGFSRFRVEMAGKAGAFARLTAGAHQLNSCEFSTSEPPPRGDRPPNNVLLGPPTPDLNISRLVLDRKSGRRMPFRFESQEPEVVPYFRSCR